LQGHISQTGRKDKARDIVTAVS